MWTPPQDLRVGTRQRPVDRGIERGRETVSTMARECRAARRSRGLSQRFVADEARVSKAWMSMFERGAVANPGVVTISRVLAVVGLDFVGRAFPSNVDAPRDAGHARLLTRFARMLSARLL